MPAHVAIIMDGNGRWAQKRGMVRLMGHKEGVKTVRRIVTAARELGIQVLTLYAFSSENWKRPPKEVTGLMALLRSYLQSELTSMLENNIQLRCMGHRERLPAEVREVLGQTMDDTRANSGMVLNLALSYGGRDEIVRAARRLAELCRLGELAAEEITEEVFASQLFSAGLPDPDLLIRTGGEFRLSNFLLWQASYAELYVTDINWPDFNPDRLIAAIGNYQMRQRRFGRTGDQVREDT